MSVAARRGRWEASLRLQSNEELQQLEQDIARANYDKPLNVNSPKQVSLAIFGNIQSTTLEVLQQAAKGEGVVYNRQQTLANLILQHKALTKIVKQRQQSTTFSTLAADKNDDNAVQVEQVVNGIVDKDNDSLIVLETTSSASVVASYGQIVEDLFYKKSKIDSFWKEALLRVTKPSARNMVMQLNPAVCPMGFDPTAAPTGSLKTTLEPTAGKKGSLLAYVRENKQRYPDCIILTRVGDFYETYGMDAVLLVEVSALRRIM
jgi:ribosomal protein L25 (general stress protein Ctc)